MFFFFFLLIEGYFLYRILLFSVQLMLFLKDTNLAASGALSIFVASCGVFRCSAQTLKLCTVLAALWHSGILVPQSGIESLHCKANS